MNTPGGADEFAHCNMQNEVSLAAHGQDVVAAWVDAGRCDLTLRHLVEPRTVDLSLNGYAWSHDGGRTWTDAGYLVPPSGWSYFGDPVVAAGPDGTFYQLALAREHPLVPQVPPSDPLEPTRSGRSLIALTRSVDGGETFGPPVDVTGAGRPPGAFQDKPWIAVDRSDAPTRGNVYVIWTEFASDEPLSSETTVLFARSVDGGETFEPPVKMSGPPVGFMFDKPGVGAQLAIGPEGEVYAIWPGPTGGAVFFSRSTDGGVSFSQPIRASESFPVGNESDTCETERKAMLRLGVWTVNGEIRVPMFPAIAVDTSGSNDPEAPDFNPYRGRVYIAVPHNDTNVREDVSDVWLVWSSDRGETWDIPPSARPVHRVNDDDTSNDQFQPSIAVDDAANVLVTWYDRREDPDNLAISVYGAVSTNGGLSFEPNFRIGDASFPPTINNPQPHLLRSCYMGDYNATIGAGDGEFLVAWGDNRDGPPENPDANVYLDRVQVG